MEKKLWLPSLCLVILATLFEDVIAYTASPICGTQLQQKILSQLFADYDRDIRPPGNGPTEITIDLEILNVLSVEVKNHVWTTNMYVDLSWQDDRLRYEHLISNCTNLPFFQLSSDQGVARVWKPNYAIDNEVSGQAHELLHTNRVIRIYPNGLVFYATHVSVTLFCKFEEGTFPGQFRCPMVMEAFGDITYNRLKWRSPNPVVVDQNRIARSGYEVGDVTTAESVNEGNFSELTANFGIHYVVD